MRGHWKFFHASTNANSASVASAGFESGRTRLVEQEDLRVPHDGPAERDPLPLAAGELRGPAVQERCQLERLGGLRHASVPLGLRGAPHCERETDVLANTEVRIERVVLEDHRDVAVLGRQVVDAHAVDLDVPRAGLLEPGDAAERGGLAASRRAEEHEELAGRDVERERVERRGVRPEPLGELAEGDGGHGREDRPRPAARASGATRVRRSRRRPSRGPRRSRSTRCGAA